MAFIRSYRQQGDPFPASFYRGGLLVRSPFAKPRVTPSRLTPTARPVALPDYRTMFPLGYRRSDLMLGDPFLGKLFKKAGKALKKVTLKGVVKGVGNVVRAVAPVASVLLPGVGGLVASAIAARAASSAPAPDPVIELPVATTMPVLDSEPEPVLQEERAATETAAGSDFDSVLFSLYQRWQTGRLTEEQLLRELLPFAGR